MNSFCVGLPRSFVWPAPDGRRQGRPLELHLCSRGRTLGALHRHLARAATRPETSRSTFCQLATAEEPSEWQGGHFADCLLMRKDSARDAFGEVAGELCLVVKNVRSALASTRPSVHSCSEQYHYFSEWVCEVGWSSNVSKQAIFIRFHELGAWLPPAPTSSWAGDKALVGSPFKTI